MSLAENSPTTKPSRRHFLASAPVAALLAGRVTIPSFDPIFAAIERHKEAHAAFDSVCTVTDEQKAENEGRVVTDADHNTWNYANQAEVDALSALIETVPQSRQGLRAVIDHLAAFDILGYDPAALDLFFDTLLQSPALAA